MYEPTEGNYKHWALYLDENLEKNTIFEVIGQHPHFEPQITKANPEYSRRHIRSILVATIREIDVNGLKDQMASMPVDNDTSEWNCQDYCIESIDKLYEECIIDDDDKDYKKGRKTAVDKYFGAL